MSGLPLSPFSSKPPGSPSSSSTSTVTSVPSSLPQPSSSNRNLGHPEVQDHHVNPVVLISDRIGEDSSHGGRRRRLNFIQGGGFVLVQDFSVLGRQEVYTDTVMIPNQDQINVENRVHGGGGGGGGGGGVVFLEGGGFFLIQIVPELVLDQDVIYQEIPPNNDLQIGENLVVHGGGGGAIVFLEGGGGFEFVQVQNDEAGEPIPIPNAVNPPPIQPQNIPDDQAATAAAARLQRWLQKKKEKREKEEEQRTAKQVVNDALSAVEDYEYQLFCLENLHLFNQASSPSSEDDPVPATSCNMCPRSRFMSVEARRKHHKVHKGYNVECKNINCGCIFKSDRIEESHRERRH